MALYGSVPIHIVLCGWPIIYYLGQIIFHDAIVVQEVSSDPKPLDSDAISGENPEVEQIDAKESVDEPIEKR